MAYFFTDLAESNGCGPGDYWIEWDKVFKECECLPGLASVKEDFSICCGVGVQRMELGKDREGEGTTEKRPSVLVNTQLCLLRLKKVQTDLLIVFSKEASPLGNITGGAGGQPDDRTVDLPFSPVFKMVLESFVISDWSLFC